MKISQDMQAVNLSRLIAEENGVGKKTMPFNLAKKSDMVDEQSYRRNGGFWERLRNSKVLNEMYRA